MYICVLCTKPITFKYKTSFQRHFQLKHNRGVASLFACDWCSYEATQKVNLVRHNTRCHKSVSMVSGLVESLVDDSFELSNMCEYERIRARRIKENKALLELLFPRPQVPASKKFRKHSVKKIPLKTRSSPRNSRMSAEATPSVAVFEEVVSTGTSSVVDTGELSVKSALFQCQVCEFKSGYKHSLERHIKKKHELLDELLSCFRPFCNLTFSTRWAMEHHVGQCLLVCQREECHGKVFDRVDKFQQHTRMHKRMDEDY